MDATNSAVPQLIMTIPWSLCLMDGLRYDFISSTPRMIFVVNDSGQREQFGADCQTGPLDCIYIDGEANSSVVHVKLDSPAAFREFLALSYDQLAGVLQLAQNFRQ